METAVDGGERMRVADGIPFWAVNHVVWERRVLIKGCIVRVNGLRNLIHSHYIHVTLTSTLDYY